MQIEPHVLQVQSQLAAAASLGDDTTRAIADALATTVQPAVRLAVLEAVSAAADEITAALLDAPGAPAVSVRLDGDDLRIEVRPSDVAVPAVEQPAAGPEEESTARISLRLSESLKSQIEEAARADSVSVNTWIVRAATRALGEPGPGTAPWGGPPWGGFWGGPRGGPWGGPPRGGGPWGGRSGNRVTGWVNA